MFKNIITIALMFSPGLLFAQDDVAKSAWIYSPVKVDGNPQEWIQPLRYYDANTKLFFAFANDSKNLYLCFQSPDEMNQMKIMYAGLKITLSTKGKHKASINFPLVQKSEAAKTANENSDQQRVNRKSMESGLLAQDTMMEVKGFATKNGVIPINDNSGINAAINWDETNKFTYEVAIPLKELFGEDYNAANISKDISMDIEVNALSKSGRSGSGDNSFSGRGGGGRMGGGGMHHERNANGEENDSQISGVDKSAMFEKSKLKQKFILAQEK